jgi:hypothetical protein
MSFFEPPPPPPPPEPSPPPPRWFGPRDNELPSSFPLDLVIARNDDVAIFVHGGRAYRDGFDFMLAFRLRQPMRGRAHDPVMAWHGAGEGTLDDSVLRFGIAFADGRKATVFDRFRTSWPAAGEQGTPPEIVLAQRGGGGGGGAWEMRFWVWPLPPAGLLAFVVEWPSQGVALTEATVETEPIRAAADRAEELWPGGGAQPGGGWVGGGRIA